MQGRPNPGHPCIAAERIAFGITAETQPQFNSRARQDTGIWDLQPDTQVQGGWRITRHINNNPTLDGFECTLGMPAMRWHNGGWQGVWLTNAHCTHEERNVNDTTYFFQAGLLFGREIIDPAGHTCGFWPCRHADVAMILPTRPIQLAKIARLAGSGCGGEDDSCPSADEATDAHVQLHSTSPTYTITAISSNIENEVIHKIGMDKGWTFGEVEDTCDDWLHDSDTNWISECNDRVDFCPW